MPAPRLISVIIPVHNRHQLFFTCIQSVFAQRPFGGKCEVIIVDEASTPPIKLSALPVPPPQFSVTIVRNHRALGPSLARDRGLRLASGDLIAFLDSDDIWQPEFLLATSREIEHQKKLIITTLAQPVFSGTFKFSQRIHYYILSQVRNLAFIFCLLVFRELPSSMFYLLRLSNTIFSASATGSCRFLMSYRTAEDWKFFWDCLRTNHPGIKILPRNLVKFTYHLQSETLRRSNYWHYYYKLINELPLALRSSLPIKFFLWYTNLNAAKT